MNACLRIGSLEFTGDQLVASMAKFQLLETFVGQVILDSVLQSISLTESEVFQALGGGDGSQTPPNFSAFVNDWLQSRQLSLAYFQQVVLRQLRLEKLKRDRFDGYIESEFLRRKAEFDQVEFSLIRTSNRILAQELYFQIRDDRADVGALAQQYSEGTERHTKGIMGPMKLAELPSAIRTIFNARTRGVQQPISIDSKYWIVRLEQFYPAHMTLQVRNEIREYLFNGWLKAKAKAFMSDPEKVQVLSSRTTDSLPNRTSQSQSLERECA
jgi:parvulin-like peptidyl-prolyl isomerase